MFGEAGDTVRLIMFGKAGETVRSFRWNLYIEVA
jgi:hypothetical protein